MLQEIVKNKNQGRGPEDLTIYSVSLTKDNINKPETKQSSAGLEILEEVSENFQFDEKEENKKFKEDSREAKIVSNQNILLEEIKEKQGEEKEIADKIKNIFTQKIDPDGQNKQ